MTSTCPRCHRFYEDPARFHRHLVEELREVEEEFDELIKLSRLRLSEIKLLARLNGQEVPPRMGVRID